MCPIFLANCGGIIHVGAEVLHLGEAEVEDLVARAIERTGSLLEKAMDEGTVPMDLAEAHAADSFAQPARGFPDGARLMEALLGLRAGQSNAGIPSEAAIGDHRITSEFRRRRVAAFSLVHSGLSNRPRSPKRSPAYPVRSVRARS